MCPQCPVVPPFDLRGKGFHCDGGLSRVEKKKDHADKQKRNHHTCDGSLFRIPVELRGLEPLTPCMPCRCATSCATAPYFCSFRSNSPEQPDQSNALLGWMPIGRRRHRNRFSAAPFCHSSPPIEAARNRPATKKSAGTMVVPADLPVELRGLEPLTPCMPCRCATSCATAPDCCCSEKLSSGSPPKQLKYLRTAIPKIPNREYSLSRTPSGAAPTRSRRLPRLWRMRRPQAADPPRGSPSRAAPARRTHGPPHAGRG